MNFDLGYTKEEWLQRLKDDPQKAIKESREKFYAWYAAKQNKFNTGEERRAEIERMDNMPIR